MAWAHLRLGAAAGFIPIGVVVVGLTVVMLVFFTDVGPRRQLEGVVTGLAGRDGRLGPFATVQFADGVASVRISPIQLCVVGDRIDLQERKLSGGRRMYIPGPKGCTRARSG